MKAARLKCDVHLLGALLELDLVKDVPVYAKDSRMGQDLAVQDKRLYRRLAELTKSPRLSLAAIQALSTALELV
jgi:hypothetical protein